MFFRKCRIITTYFILRVSYLRFSDTIGCCSQHRPDADWVCLLACLSPASTSYPSRSLFPFIVVYVCLPINVSKVLNVFPLIYIKIFFSRMGQNVNNVHNVNRLYSHFSFLRSENVNNVTSPPAFRVSTVGRCYIFRHHELLK